MRFWRYTWSCHDGDWPRWQPFMLRWLAVHGLDANTVFAIDHLGYRWVRVHAYALNENGAKYLDRSKDDVVTVEPVEYRW